MLEGVVSSPPVSVSVPVDGDGDLDAFVANGGASFQANRVWLNDGSGAFTDSGQSLGTHASRDVTLGDVDGDGDLDAFVANRFEGNRVWLGDGNGNFTDSGQALGTHDSLNVSLGDVDGDGDLDAFVAGYGANRVWLNDSSGNFTNSGQSLGDDGSRGVRLGDVDGDGDLDAFVVNPTVSRVWVNDGSGNFSDSGQALVGGSLSWGVSLGDLDDDGDLDAFVVERFSFGHRVWLNDGSGTFSDSGQSLGSSNSFGVSLGDVDGDGDLDAFVVDGGQGNLVWFNRQPQLTLSILPVSVSEDDGPLAAEGTVTRSSDTTDALTVNLLSDDTTEATVPLTVEIPAGQASATFDIAALTDMIADGTQTVAITASEAGHLDGTDTLDVTDIDGPAALTLEVLPVSVSEDDGPMAAVGTVTRNTDTTNALTVDLASDDTTEATVPLTVEIPAGQASATFDIAAEQDAIVDGTQTVTITAGEAGHVDGTDTLDVTDIDVPILTLTILPVSVSEGAGAMAAVGTVTRNTDTTSALTVNLASDDTTEATVPLTVEIPADEFSATFDIGAEQDAIADGTQTVTITAGAAGHPDGMDTLEVTDDEAMDLSITKTSGPVWVTQGDAVTYTIMVTNAGPDDVTGATVTDTFPDTLAGMAWTAVLTGGGTANLDGVGDINETIDLASGSFITYTVTGTVVSAGAANLAVESIVTNPATVTGPVGAVDSNLSNNTAHDSDVVVVAADGGSGLFGDSGQSLGNDGDWDVALGDLDGDGDLDAFAANGGGNPSAVWVNDGSGTFTDSGQSLGGHEGRDVSLGDLDGDGDLDAFVFTSGANRVWTNDGSGTFTDSGQSLGNGSSFGGSLGDLDGDGDLDAFAANMQQANRVWWNDGSGNFTDSGQSLGNHTSWDVNLGDVDADGDLDAFVANFGSGQAHRVWLNDGSGNFSDSAQTLAGSGADFGGLSLGDVDGDGDLDAFVVHFGQGNQVWLNNGSGNFTDSGQSLGNHASFDVSLGDVDGDGDLDAFVANGGPLDQPNRVWINDGSGSFTDSGQTLGNHNSFGVSVGDVDGDGDLDAFVANLNRADRVWLNANPPRITEVLIGGSSWTGAFLDQLEPAGAGGTRGYAIPSGAAQLDPLPWADADQVILRFGEPVDVAQTDLALRGTLGPDGVEDASDDYAFSAFATETGPTGAFQAVWTLSSAIGSDRLLLILDDANVAASASGLALDGEWADETSSFPSGDGAAGGDFAFRFDVAPADVDRDGAATIFDIRPLRDALGTSAGAPAYSIFADLNGDATVDDLDKEPLRAELGRVLPAGSPQGATVRGGGPGITLTGDDWVVTTPSGAAAAGSVDIVLDTSDGSSVDLLNYSVRVRLDGPGAGTQVALTGGGEASTSPAATAPDPLNASGNVDRLPDEYYHGTVNFTETSFSVDD
ncbi:MAG: hypothetical protein CMJ18_19220, partial [Phycisphaeraceae bacterium]|nr:hypothetical protein [Phycisphaeraceae bacterium]